MKDLHTLDKFRLKNAEMSIYGSQGDNGNGCFKVYIDGKAFFVIAANGGGWDHVSVSPCNEKRKFCPTWEEMCKVKDMFFEPQETVIQYHPKESNYINLHPYCLHLWRPIEKEIPTPPLIFV